jgi:tetratricopeptide (TPR) repeat protein
MCGIRICAATPPPRPPEPSLQPDKARFGGLCFWILQPMNFEFWWRYQRARALLFFNRTEAAIAELETLLQCDPSSVRVTSLLGYLHGTRGDYARAIALFRRALANAPANPVFKFDLAYVLHLNKDYIEAIEWFRQVVSADKLHDRAWYGMGLALSAMARHGEAAVALEHAAELQPMNGFAWYELGRAYDALGQRSDLAKVIAHLNRVDPKAGRQLAKDTGRNTAD